MTMSRDENSAIRIYLRARPSRRSSSNVTIDVDDCCVEFLVPRDKSSGYVNNQTERHCFAFDGVFNGDADQENVFDTVALDVIHGSLDGYNGTVFAYGQTGSGKTYTITGGPERYADRGMIPRTISKIFSEIARRSDNSFTIHVSYLEIYNDVVYDLLDPDREIKEIDDLPKVLVREDDDGKVVLTNLRVCNVETEEDALGLLFLGDTNRAISETPMNMASSRSHCVFSIHIQSRQHGADVVRRSKLNLVDLAGSERSKKTGIDGVTLLESKYINLSLHYLEQVIVALQESASGIGRMHIPYRNSAMTMLLRDSLGGNCRTVMIANISIEQRQLDESISTCRFAQRVAMISNEAVVNEEVDPSLVIARLKAEITDLKQEIRTLKGEGTECNDVSFEEEQQQFKKALTAYCDCLNAVDVLDLDHSVSVLRYGFQVMRELVWEARKRTVHVLPHEKLTSKQFHETSVALTVKDSTEDVAETRRIDKRKQFDASYSRQDIIKDNEEQLRLKFAAAKAEGQKLTESKRKLEELKAVMEERRRKQIVAQLRNDCLIAESVYNSDAKGVETADLETLNSLAREKARYKEAFYALRDLKKDIESLQTLLEHNERKKQKEYDTWTKDQNNRNEVQTMQMAEICSIQEEIPSNTMACAQERFVGNSEVDKDILEFYRIKAELQTERS